MSCFSQNHCLQFKKHYCFSQQLCTVAITYRMISSANGISFLAIQSSFPPHFLNTEYSKPNLYYSNYTKSLSIISSLFMVYLIT